MAMVESKLLVQNVKKNLNISHSSEDFETHLLKAIEEIKMASESAKVTERDIVMAILRELKRESRPMRMKTNQESDMERMPYAYFTRLLMIKHGHEFIKDQLPDFFKEKSEQPEPNHVKVHHILAIKHHQKDVPYYALANENKVLDALVHMGYVKRVPNSKNQLADDLYLTKKGEEIIEELRQDPAYLRRLFQRARNKNLRDFLSHIWNRHIEPTPVSQTA